MQVVILGVTFYIELKVEPNTATKLQKKTLFGLAKSGAPAMTMTRKKDGREVVEIYTPDKDLIELERDLLYGIGVKGESYLLAELATYFPVLAGDFYRAFTDKELLF